VRVWPATSPTTAAEFEFVLAAEADLEAAPWIIRWSRDEHQGALSDPDQAHLLVLGPGGPVGFVLLAGLTDHRAVELRRIVDEGVLRDALLTGDSFESLVVMSILEHEWSP
jgi:hypothetical protein